MLRECLHSQEDVSTDLDQTEDVLKGTPPLLPHRLQPPQLMETRGEHGYILRKHGLLG